MTAGGLIIAAPASGTGKTLFTLGLLRLLTRRGVAVLSAKAGPDYIDPAFHAAATGQSCPNLDGWALRPASLDGLVGDLGARGQLVIAEGVMGLFDGADLPGSGPKGSTADLAMRTGWPVILVVDGRGMTVSAAALLAGFAGFRGDVRVAGVVFNRVAGEKHRRMIAQACEAACPRVSVLGFLPSRSDLALPSRHLGLVQAGEHPQLRDFLDQAADWVGAHVDLDRLVGLARPSCLCGPSLAPLPPLGQRIWVARDEAFSFSYDRVLQGWRDQGAEITLFSPLADQPAQGDSVYLPGGYPELHAARLAGNGRFLDSLARIARAGGSIYGECGGYMVLGQHLIDAAGSSHAMAGLLPVVTDFSRRHLHLGYRRVRLAQACALGSAGQVFRGHEFHFSVAVQEGASPLFAVADSAGRDLGLAGAVQGRVAGSYIHLIETEDLTL